MTIDPAFALLISIPIILLAIAAAIAARPSRGTAAIMAGCAVLALIVGCGKPAEQAQTTAAAPPGGAASPSVARAIRVAPFSAAQLVAAYHAKGGGGVAVDVLDVRPDGAHNADGVTIGAADTLYVIGWAYDDSKRAPCDAIGLVVDEKRVFSGSYGYARTDVAAFYKDPARTNVGYGITVPARKFGTGSHTVQVACVAKSDARTTPSALKITIR